MVGKKFTSLVDGRVVEIKDMFEDIVILNDNSKVKASRLMDKNFFEEYIDPRNFFSNQNLLESFAQKIKQIPDAVVNKMTNEEKSAINESLNDPDFRPRFDESAVLPADPELEKEELMRKYGISNANVYNSSNVEAQKQLERFASLIEELKEDSDDDNTVQRIEVERDTNQAEDRQVITTINNLEDREVSVPKQEDPIITMFKNVKRNKEFKITLDIVNNIPRPDFIEMMEDSYNTSIIDFLAEEFTNSLLVNPSIIKDKIIEEIKKIVYTKNLSSVESEIPPKKEVVKTNISKTRTTRSKKDLTK
jgi:hypothetical protein